MVRLEHVTFGYAEDRPVLHDLTFELRPGEFLAVFGANGAGKSTLCYLLSGVVPHIFGGARRGDVEVDGIDPWDVPMWETGRHVAIVLQDPESQLSMPEVGLELALGPSNFGVPAEEIRRRVERVLPVVRLEGLERQATHALSGGQKQRVALGAALVMQPRLLLLDEPTSQLDPLGHREVLEALGRLRLRETGQAVIMTTHNWDVEDLADRVLVLHEGRVAAFGPTAEVLAQTELLERAGVQPPPLQRFWDFLREAAGAGGGAEAGGGSSGDEAAADARATAAATGAGGPGAAAAAGPGAAAQAAAALPGGRPSPGCRSTCTRANASASSARTGPASPRW
ncbi:MAG: ABC transporter ATP-binding protein [Firmicutes bacterium]|nr:ABC transporter ATP-binding protein [Bacillota bacterium]